jgi:DNA-binding NarL/FixJ family response regulator
MSTCGAVLVVDDDPAIRDLIATLLRRAGFSSHVAATSEEALRLADADPPAVALVDVDLGGGGSGYELFRELRDRIGRIPIIFISGARTEPFDRVGGLLIGADDYIVKPFEPDELIARIRNLAMRPGAREQLRQGRERPDASSPLTPREHEVLQLLAEGVSQREIARRLVVSPKTIGSHIQSILAKLEVHSRTEAVVFAYRAGLVESFSDGTAHRPAAPST